MHSNISENTNCQFSDLTNCQFSDLTNLVQHFLFLLLQCVHSLLNDGLLVGVQ